MSQNLKYKVLLNQLVSVSLKDEFLGPIDKWTCHTNKYLRQAGSFPHRAFSIFLFNCKNQLMFQRRSIQKKTFPLCWTNTCCSHPNMIEQQDGTRSIENIRNALHRALDRQLKVDLTKETFYLVDKILYKAQGKQQFGEFQVDYVFLCKLNTQHLHYQLVKDQIHQVQWVNKKSLNQFVKSKIDEGSYFSPWFQKMNQNGLLLKWWQQAETDTLVNRLQNQIQVKNYL